MFNLGFKVDVFLFYFWMDSIEISSYHAGPMHLYPQ